MRHRKMVQGHDRSEVPDARCTMYSQTQVCNDMRGAIPIDGGDEMDLMVGTVGHELG